jgi:hypothetical protein
MAKGSHTTRGGWEPKTCCICTKPIVINRDNGLRFNFNDYTGGVLAWHVQCEKPGWPHLDEPQET